MRQCQYESTGTGDRTDQRNPGQAGSDKKQQCAKHDAGQQYRKDGGANSASGLAAPTPAISGPTNGNQNNNKEITDIQIIAMTMLPFSSAE